MKILNTQEHTFIENEFEKEQLDKFNDSFKKDDFSYLGIHQEFDGCELKLKSHYHIGYRWIDEDSYIHVAPKNAKGGFQADYLKMFLTCLQDPVVSKHLDETYKIFFHEKWIDIGTNKDDITPFLILEFLDIVYKISKKGLKKGYVKVTQNLTSKIKGRILVDETIKQNSFKNRVDKTVCNHQIFTTNTIENQILKTALLQCSRNLYGIENESIAKLLKLNLNFFELVDKKNVVQTDFTTIRHSPFYKEYKKALHLAQMIFKRFGFSLSSSTKEQENKIPPFYINMPELFERYVEIELRKKYGENLQAGYGQKSGNGYIWGLRPDFLVKDKKLIIDAKYKYWFEDTTDNKLKDDFQQLSLYGRVTKIREDIGLLDSEEAELLFIYPKKDGEDEMSFEKFNNIYKMGIGLPYLDEKAH